MTQAEFGRKVDAIEERIVDLASDLYSLRYKNADMGSARELAQIARHLHQSALSAVKLANTVLAESAIGPKERAG